jgi:NADH dehydrogenase [ubiquinone] 1 alpha subcomplex assembly factor 2
MEEQRDDVTRQVRMKQLAAAADARWEAKPRLVEDPSGAHALPHAAPKQTDSAAGNGSAHRTAESTEETDDAKISNESRPDPWAQHRSHGPGEKWQPSAWNPSAPKSKTSKP